MRPTTTICSVAFLLLAPAWAQQYLDLNRYIENPRMFAENQEPAHVPLVPYPNVDLAREDDWSKSPFFQSLNGKWRFHWSVRPEEAPQEFHKPDYDVGRWDQIAVPSVWQTEGYGHAVYRNIPMDLSPYDPPRVPDDLNPVGCYRRTFSLPANWQGREVFLHFDGVKSAYFVWVNGKYVGYDQGSMTAAEYRITEHVTEGENVLAVKVFRWSDGSYLEDQDMWRFSGIYRDVYLFSTPKAHIRDFFVRTDLDGEYRDARLLVSAELKDYSGGSLSGYAVEAELFDASGQPVAQFAGRVGVGAPDTAKLELSQDVSAPHKWSAEKPYRYTLVLKLLAPDGEVREALSEKVGFRKVEVRDRQILVNGVAVNFKGVNRHEHSPDSGRTMTVELMKEDIFLMKQFNVNAVRHSHYPNDPRWYELADEYGLYLMDEINAECHYGTWLSDVPAWTDAFLDRFGRMLERDKNHPSVLFWSTGNECGLGRSHFQMADMARERDPSRLLYHQSNRPDGSAPYVDVDGQRYPSPARLRAIAGTTKRPVVMGEYAHAMGNSLGHFDEFWELINNEKPLQGGYIWDWVDQGLREKLILTPDATRYRNDGALMGRPKVVEGRSGKGLALSGLDDWVEIYRDPSLDITGKQLTLEAWIYPRNWNGANPIITKGDHQFALEQKDEKTLEFSIHSGKRISVEAEAPGDWSYNWHHVAAVYDGVALALYVDGERVASTKFSGDIDNSVYPVNIGRNAEKHVANYQGWLSNAVIDQVRIYRRALSEQELRAAPSAPPPDAVLWLDFDEFADKGEYLSYGISNFCINGVIFADRKPQPELWQMKKSHSPVEVQPTDLVQGKVRIINRHNFTNLSELAANWKLLADDQMIQSGAIPLDIPPGGEREIQIPFRKPKLTAGVEYWLVLEFLLAQGEPWAKKGHEVAFAQFKVPFETPAAVPLKLVSNLSVTEADSLITLAGKNFTYILDKSQGTFTSLRYRGTEILTRGPALNVWRAPIPNEVVSWGQAESLWWIAAGLDRLEHSVAGIVVKQLSEMAARIEVSTITTAGGRAQSFRNRYVYDVLGSGDIVLRHTVIPEGDNIPWLPKIGLQMEIGGDFRNVGWYGRGPMETYPDRRTGAKIGVYEKKVEDLYVPYMVGQDQGNMTDVRWVALTNGTEVGLAVFGMPAMNVSVHEYENLDRAVYEFQLRKKDTLTLNIDHRVTGVGGTPVTARPEFRTYPDRYEYTVRLRPFSVKSVKEETPRELSRQRLSY